MPKPTKKDFSRFINLLEKWDYYYFQNDSNILYRKGKAQETKLRELASNNTHLQNIFKQFQIVKDTQETIERRVATRKLEELKALASNQPA